MGTPPMGIGGLPCAGARDDRCHPDPGMCACFDTPVYREPHGQQICERCGRKGVRGFVVVAGKGLRYGGDEQVVCANRDACDRRLAAAEQKEGWS